MEDENYLQEQLAILQAHYNYMWANSYSNKRSPFGHERKELLSDISKQINDYQKRLDIAKTINQTESMICLYKNMLETLDARMYGNNCSSADIEEHKQLESSITRLENRLLELKALK